MHTNARRPIGNASGFTLTDMMATIAVFAIVSAIAIPTAQSLYDNQRLGVSARLVERELQTARLSAVTANQPIRVRFNCPAAGQFRRVELIGTIYVPATDDADSQAAVRCSTTNYPYPPADTNPLSRPNHDGPVQQLDRVVTFSAATTLEFWPNGSVHQVNGTNPSPLIDPVNGVTITLSRTGGVTGTTTKSITVNSLGKIQLQ